MASLNTLRTRFGILLSIIIAGALLAFILSLKTEMGFSGQDPRVAVIDGQKINYSEYYNEYERIRSQSNIQESDEMQSAQLANAVWQTMISRYVFTPGFERMGLWLTEPERRAILSGEHASALLMNNFGGTYDAATVAAALEAANGNPQMEAAWRSLNDQLRLERAMQKFVGLARGGVYANALEVANGVKTANETFSGKWAGKTYASVPDSLFTVSDSEVKAYYKKNKSAYRQVPSRRISYVLFEVEPTEEDKLALNTTAHEVYDEFVTITDKEELRKFVRKNRYGHIDDRYITAAQLPVDEADALMAGNPYGPVEKNNEWTMSRALDIRMLPDSIGLRSIVLSYAQRDLADSLTRVLEGGADFKTLAAQYSQGGESDNEEVVPFSMLSPEFSGKLLDAKKGDVVDIQMGQYILLVQVSRTGTPVKHVQVASITYPVEASDATRRNIHSQAGLFATAAKKSFDDAVAEASVTPRIVAIPQGMRTIRGIDDSREVVRWACGAEEGDLSQIFEVGKDFMVATLIEIDDEKFVPVAEVAPQIRQLLLRNKKYDHIVKQLSGTTFAEQAASLGAEPTEFANVSYGSFYLTGTSYEPRLIGAVASTTETGVVSAPVKGVSGVYIFEVDAIDKAEKQTVADEQVREQSLLESKAPQIAIQAIEQMAEVEDLRGPYF